jgi:hypothetical protein
MREGRCLAFGAVMAEVEQGLCQVLQGAGNFLPFQWVTARIVDRSASVEPRGVTDR